jgi:hypothetical protein
MLSDARQQLIRPVRPFARQRTFIFVRSVLGPCRDQLYRHDILTRLQRQSRTGFDDSLCLRMDTERKMPHADRPD